MSSIRGDDPPGRLRLDRGPRAVPVAIASQDCSASTAKAVPALAMKWNLSLLTERVYQPPDAVLVRQQPRDATLRRGVGRRHPRLAQDEHDESGAISVANTVGVIGRTVTPIPTPQRGEIPAAVRRWISRSRAMVWLRCSAVMMPSSRVEAQRSIVAW